METEINCSEFCDSFPGQELDQRPIHDLCRTTIVSEQPWGISGGEGSGSEGGRRRGGERGTSHVDMYFPALVLSIGDPLYLTALYSSSDLFPAQQSIHLIISCPLGCCLDFSQLWTTSDALLSCLHSSLQEKQVSSPMPSFSSPVARTEKSRGLALFGITNS
jgi:hypothetical protein